MEENNCQAGTIVNTGYFSRDDVEEGRSRGIQLWDREKLIKELLKIQGKRDPKNQGLFFYLSDYLNWFLRG